MTLIALLIAALAQDPVIKGEMGSAVDAAIQRKTRGGFWGTVLVAKGGDIVLSKGYGFADYGSRPNTPATLFEIASVSKQFTAAAVLKLDMEGKLSIDDALPKHFKNVPDDKRAITIHQLLTHTSGLSPEAGLPYAAKETRDEFIAFVMKTELASEPGKRFAYCNVAYALLAALVEVVSGQSFEDYVKEKLLKPAGITDSGFIRDFGLDRRRAAARLADGDSSTSSVEWHYGWGYRGMGGVVSTGPDLLKWDRALRGLKIFDAKTKAKLYAPAKERYACGWLVEKTARGTKVHHSGGVPGFRSWYARWIEADVVVIILSNEAADVHGISVAIEQALFPPAAIELAVDVGPFELGEWSSLDLGKKAAWRVAAAGEVVKLSLEADKHAVVTIKLPKEKAAALAAELEVLVEAKGGAKGEPDMDSFLSLHEYPLKDKKLTMTADVRLMPEYRGIGEDGKEIVDERIVLVAVNEKKGHWPLLVKMNAKVAAALAKELAGK